MTHTPMTEENIAGALLAVFRKIFDRPDLTIAPQTTAADIEGWDSLAQINLLVAIEKEFKIEFVISELRSLNNVGDMIQVIARKVNHE